MYLSLSTMGKRKTRESDHVQEQCDVWLTAQGRQQTSQQKKQRILSLRPVNIIGSSPSIFNALPTSSANKTKQSKLLTYFKPKSDHQGEQPQKTDDGKENTIKAPFFIKETTQLDHKGEEPLMPQNASINSHTKHCDTSGNTLTRANILSPDHPYVYNQSDQAALSLSNDDDDCDNLPYHLKYNQQKELSERNKRQQAEPKSTLHFDMSNSQNSEAELPLQNQISQLERNNKQFGILQATTSTGNLLNSDNDSFAVERLNFPDTFSDKVPLTDSQSPLSVLHVGDTSSLEDDSCSLLKSAVSNDSTSDVGRFTKVPTSKYGLRHVENIEHRITLGCQGNWMQKLPKSNSKISSEKLEELSEKSNGNLRTRKIANVESGASSLDTEEYDVFDADLNRPACTGTQQAINYQERQRLADKVVFSQVESGSEFEDSEFPCKRLKRSQGLVDVQRKCPKNPKRKKFLIDSENDGSFSQTPNIVENNLKCSFDDESRIAFGTKTTITNLTVKLQNAVGTSVKPELEKQRKQPKLCSRVNVSPSKDTNHCQNSELPCFKMSNNSETIIGEAHEKLVSGLSHTMEDHTLVADSEFPVLAYRSSANSRNSRLGVTKQSNGILDVSLDSDTFDKDIIAQRGRNLTSQAGIIDDSEFPVISLNHSRLRKVDNLDTLSSKGPASKKSHTDFPRVAVHRHLISISDQDGCLEKETAATVVDSVSDDDDDDYCYSQDSDCGSDSLLSPEFTLDSIGVYRLKTLRRT